MVHQTKYVISFFYGSIVAEKKTNKLRPTSHARAIFLCIHKESKFCGKQLLSLFFVVDTAGLFIHSFLFFFILCGNEVRSQARCISSRYFLRHPYFSVFKKWEIEYKGNVNCRLRIICSNISVANIFTDARALKLLAKLLLPYILYLSQPRVNARLRKPQTSKLSYLIDFSLHVNFRNWN